MGGKDYVLKSTCQSNCERLREEDKRQNERLKWLEDRVEDMNKLAISTEKLATSTEKLSISMEEMVKEQKEQSARIAKLEGKDGEKWVFAVKEVGKIIIAAVLGAILLKMGLTV